jgi:hypothetical protein
VTYFFVALQERTRAKKPSSLISSSFFFGDQEKEKKLGIRTSREKRVLINKTT